MVGVEVGRHKLTVFVISAIYASVAGSYLALLNGLITPDISGFLRSIELVAMVVLGGMGSVLGSLVGAGILVVLPQALTILHDYEQIVLGIVVMGCMIYLRQGVVPAIANMAPTIVSVFPSNWQSASPVPAMTVLEVERLSIAFGGVRALKEVSLAIPSGAIFSIIGPNGAGKTTLLNVISGVYEPHDGSVRICGKDVTALSPEQLARRGLSRTFQNLQLFFRMSVLENVMVGRHRHETTNIISDLLRLPSVVRQNRHTRVAAAEALASVGLAGKEDHPTGSLAYRDLRRLEIARALASEPTILLLDEPAAGCNAVETRELDRIIRALAKGGITVVLVEHDMRLVMNISDRIHVLANGQTLAEGTAEEVRTNPAVIEAYLGVHDPAEAIRAHR
jgi:branched-chain amino acid transport system ATP-binding protein